MPSWVKLVYGVRDLPETFRTQPESFGKKKNYVYKRNIGRGSFGRVLLASWHDPLVRLSYHPNASVPCGVGLKGASSSAGSTGKRTGVKRDVALKIVRKAKLSKMEKEMVTFEINILSKLKHRNVVQFLDSFESRKNYYISFEHAAGGELFDRIVQRGGKFTERDAKAAILAILNGVQYLHANGIVHHDLKPENILLRSKAEDADIVLADFGAARHLPSSDHVLHCDTGTYDYSPPEIFTREGHGTKLDIWAVGVITHVVLSGMMPFPNSSLAVLRMAILRGELAFEGRYWQHVSDSAKSFVRCLLHTDQKTRPTASEALVHPWLNTDTNVLRKSGVGMVSAYDLPGLRENISTVNRARWHAAFAGALTISKSKVDLNGMNSISMPGRERKTPGSDDSDDESDGESLFAGPSADCVRTMEGAGGRRRNKSMSNVRNSTGKEDPNAQDKIQELHKLVSTGQHRQPSAHFSTLPRDFAFNAHASTSTSDPSVHPSPPRAIPIHVSFPPRKHARMPSEDMDSDDSGFSHSPTGSHFGSYRSRSTAATSLRGSDDELDGELDQEFPVRSRERKANLRVPKGGKPKPIDLRILV